jgi:hypothetical protein
MHYKLKPVYQLIHAACATASEVMSWFEKLNFADDKCVRTQSGPFKAELSISRCNTRNCYARVRRTRIILFALLLKSAGNEIK